MSFDPFGPGSELPPDYGPAPPMPGDAADYARQRVQTPAIALVIVGVLNLVMALTQVAATIWLAVAPQQIQKMMEDMQKDQDGRPNPYKGLFGGQDPKEIGSPASVIQNAVTSAIMVLIGVLNVFGGMRMRSLRSYALSVAGAISAAIPCLSCGGCCLFGEVIGIWALIVLLDPQVRSTFE